MDNNGRIGGNSLDNLCQKDDYGRLWTIGSARQNRRAQVRFLSHLPLTNPEFIEAAATPCAARFLCFDPY